MYPKIKCCQVVILGLSAEGISEQPVHEGVERESGS